MCDKRFNLVWMVWVMAVTLNFLTWRAEADVYSGGAGTEADPYRIGSAADWQMLAATADDWDEHFHLVLGEAIAYLTGWQQGDNPMAYAIRAAYLWQNGEQYVFNGASVPPTCWVLEP
ncbi:MAG TPA: hypothetical protein PLC40_03995 [Candidatus Hydrogenedentes bacterium]|nr:MAG: hypothetical protein BWY09_00997 [Candidatus Hydrogenedentes bacterium ADurb.Bin179]HOH28817.1 hypothetical protein [Candidatus Hydrogenedentota bacterium]